MRDLSLTSSIIRAKVLTTNFNLLCLAYKIMKKITIIGGNGRMGKIFTQKFLAFGHEVSVLGNNDWDNARKLLGEAELVLLSVPIQYTEEVIKRAAQFLTANTALADITSIKTQPVEAMLKYHRGPVMGLHPMFGPSITSFFGQKVVVCLGRDDYVFQWLLEFFMAEGSELIFCTPEEHDRMMVNIQATQHFSRFCLGNFLMQEGIDINRSLSMCSPSYRQEIEIVNRLFSQSPHLCVEIMLATEERRKAICFLAETYQRLAQLVIEQDKEKLVKEFENTQEFFATTSSQVK